MGFFAYHAVPTMGWTGRAPAPDGTQSAPGACQEKERRHASHVQRQYALNERL